MEAMPQPEEMEIRRDRGRAVVASCGDIDIFWGIGGESIPASPERWERKPFCVRMKHGGLFSKWTQRASFRSEYVAKGLVWLTLSG